METPRKTESMIEREVLEKQASVLDVVVYALLGFSATVSIAGIYQLTQTLSWLVPAVGKWFLN